MTPTPVLEGQRNTNVETSFVPERRVNPWVSDHVLLSMSLWWVRATRPDSEDMSTEVAAVFNSLQEELQ
jgi:hypothetical protein